ncbi:CDP-alcohol phosphatidyltransferase family protein [Actinoplanes utahensis]|uniref:CDP-alcohol phosphatidyltransferase n=1 Tax=Actinoplanes utahensis TaxID=1869 RepID=A0A0A6UIN5_ACTUT|nr:CDP-alcohol phosphatidyltransferase family protein [Actinoplanes utahensis]KHD74184.1 hypothetical protein MB27_30325 [Actinoplanes utahensis]GIF33670.1 hypothetical protein Aut01nite_66560 [Actinoplanes utahensis]
MTIHPSAADFRRHARQDAGLFTHAVNYPVAAHLGLLSYRLGLRPTTLTLINLLLGIAGSVLVVTLSRGGTAAVPVAVGAWLLWQAAYLADCADGQLARVTGTASPAGGRLDVLADVAVQIGLVAAVATVAGQGTPVWLVAAFAAGWMISMVTSVMAREGANLSLLPSGSLPIRLVKMVRDHGFKVTAIAVAVAVPGAMPWLLGFYTALNSAFLLAAIAQATRAAWRSTP